MIHKFLKYLLVFTSVTFSQHHDSASTEKKDWGTDDLELNTRIDRVDPEKQILKDPGYAVWGGSTILGDDGKYHMFYARWKGNGLGGWMTKSTIAHAVSDTPNGPFKHVNVVLKGSGDESRWDYNNAHNPHIKKFGKYYYLYYIASYPWKDRKLPNGKNMRPTDPQNIGVIKFKKMEDVVKGNFKILDAPICTADNEKTFNRNVNPSVTEGPDGRYYMAMKARGNVNGGGGYVHWIQVCDKPDGKFKVYAKMLDHTLGAEDPYMWYDKKRERFYAVVKEFGSRKLAPQGGALALITSKDGKEWDKAQHSIVTLKYMTLKDGTQHPVGYTDRPQLIFDKKGNIIGLNTASSRLPGQSGVYNVQLKILPKRKGENLQEEVIKKHLEEAANRGKKKKNKKNKKNKKKAQH